MSDGPRFLTGAPEPVQPAAQPVSSPGPFRQSGAPGKTLGELEKERAARAAAEARVPPPQPMPYMLVPSYHHRDRSSTILMFGVMSLVVCSVLGPIAWSMGNEELRRIDAGETSPQNRGLVQGGRICGIISSVMLILACVLIIGLFVLAGLADGGHYK